MEFIDTLHGNIDHRIRIYNKQPSAIYLGFRQRMEFFRDTKSFHMTDTPDMADSFCGIPLIFVNKDDHLGFGDNI